jgi:steroid 5-alpha reductase family enzyme
MTEKISSGKYPDYSTYQKEVPKFIPRLFRRK